VATVDAQSPFVYYIQKKNPGGTWQIWMRGVTTKSVIFDSTGQLTETYSFRSRLRNTFTVAKSLYSPAKSITVT
jgi:hypothetical protein